MITRILVVAFALFGAVRVAAAEENQSEILKREIEGYLASTVPPALYDGYVPAPRESWKLSAMLSTRIWSKYLTPFGKDVSDGKPVIQTDLKVKIGDQGFYVDVWNSAGLTNTAFSNGPEDELEYKIGWEFETLPALRVDLSLGYYDLHRVFGGGIDPIVPQLVVSREFGAWYGDTVLPYFKVRRFEPTNDAEAGWEFRIGLAYATTRLPRDLSLQQNLYVLYDSGFFGKDQGFLGSYSVELWHKLNEQVDLNLFSFQTIVPLEEFGDGRETEVLFGFGARVRF
jgi:hypothetical protein